MTQHNTHVCPWWLAFTFDNPVRRLLHNPQKILGEFIAAGDTVADFGCGMGYFSVAMAKMVGSEGRVISVDLQQAMLDRVFTRAGQAGVQARTDLHQCQSDRIGLSQPASLDFALAFWMVHEVPNRNAFLAEIRSLLKSEARFLIAEPKMHVSAADFRKTVGIAESVGLKPCAEPKITFSRAMLFMPN